MVHSFKNLTMQTCHPRTLLPSIYHLNPELENPRQVGTGQHPGPAWSSSSSVFGNSPLALMGQPTQPIYDFGPAKVPLASQNFQEGWHPCQLPLTSLPSPASSTWGSTSNTSTLSTPASTTASPRFSHADIYSQQRRPAGPRVRRESRVLADCPVHDVSDTTQSTQFGRKSLRKTQAGRVKKDTGRAKASPKGTGNIGDLPQIAKLKKVKDKDEQKRRAGESILLCTMQTALTSTGKRFTKALSVRNKNVSGLDYPKQEIMQEFILENEELQDPRRAEIRFQARLDKLLYQQEQAHKLLDQANNLTLSDKRQTLEKVAFDLQRLLSPRYLALAGIKPSNLEFEDHTVQIFKSKAPNRVPVDSVTFRCKLGLDDKLVKSFKNLAQVPEEELRRQISFLTKTLEEEMKNWQQRVNDSHLRIIRLKLQLFYEDCGFSVISRTNLQECYRPLRFWQKSKAKLWRIAEAVQPYVCWNPPEVAVNGEQLSAERKRAIFFARVIPFILQPSILEETLSICDSPENMKPGLPIRSRL